MSLKRQAARVAIGFMLMVGPIIGCDDDSDYYPYYSSSGFGGSSGTSGSTGATGYYGDAGAEYCETVVEGVSCYTSRVVTSCEQGPGANANCNSHLSCDDGLWTKEPPQRTSCAPIAACPATYTESVGDDLCKRPDAISILCEYDEGTCGCAPVGGVIKPGTPKDAGKDSGDSGDAQVPTDAGSKADAGPRTYEWKCVQPDHDAGCPRRRPREGIDCVRPLHCDYGYCVFEDGYQMNCSTGSWVRELLKRSEQCDQ